MTSGAVKQSALLDVGPRIALVCWALFVATVLAMPLLKDGYSPVDEAISYGAIGEFAWVQLAGFFGLATGTSILAFCLSRETQAQQIVVVLLAISAIGVVVLAVFQVDAHGQATSTTGSLHSAGANVAFLATVAAMLWSGRSFGHDGTLARLVPLSLTLGAIAAVLLIALAASVGPTGLVQRATVACEIAWLSAVALHLHYAGRRANLQARPAGQTR